MAALSKEERQKRIEGKRQKENATDVSPVPVEEKTQTPKMEVPKEVVNPTDDGNPLFDGTPIEREYSNSSSIKIEGSVPVDGVPVPEEKPLTVNFDTPVNPQYDSDGDEPTQPPNNNGGSPNSATNPTYPNSDEGNKPNNNGMFDPEFAEKDKKVQNFEAGNLADGLVDMLKQLYAGISTICKKDIDRLQFKAAMGKFNMAVLNAKIDLGSAVVPMKEFIEYYNSQVETTMVLSPEREEQLRILLKRIAKKRGLGLSDEGMLIWILIQEFLEKVPTMWGLSSMMNAILKNQENILINQGKKEKPVNGRSPKESKGNVTAMGGDEHFKEKDE